jgi:hypothetical protein
MDKLVIDYENLYNDLLQIDRQLALEIRVKGCPHCGGVLHSANYPRVLKGLSGLFAISQVVRFSFCCSSDECRRRITPPSVRFLGRKQYPGVVVLLLCARRHLSQQPISGALRAHLGPHENTVRRWQTWWRNIVPATQFWTQAKGLIMPPLDTRTLCDDLMELFSVTHSSTGLYKLLRFISPLSSCRISELGAR